MRTALTFDCDGAVLAATLDTAPGTTGLLIVSGGNEIRSGAHRGMAALAARVADAGHPVLRFDRRGIGDSEGENSGYAASRDDIAAAIAAFKTACPTLQNIVAFGNCDAASALVLHQPLALDALVLANPWTIEQDEVSGDSDAAPALPPASTIRSRYVSRLRDPATFGRLLRGEINLGKLAKGLVRLVRRAPSANAMVDSLGARVVDAINTAPQPVLLLLASHDRTAQAFIEAWDAREFGKIRCLRLASGSHSFAGNDADWLADQLLAELKTAVPAL